MTVQFLDRSSRIKGFVGRALPFDVVNPADYPMPLPDYSSLYSPVPEDEKEGGAGAGVEGDVLPPEPTDLAEGGEPSIDQHYAAGGPIPVHFPTDPNAIVDVTVSTVLAPKPNDYQNTGCFVSHGSTLLAPGTVAQLQTRADLERYVMQPIRILSATYAPTTPGNGTFTYKFSPGALPTWAGGWAAALGNVTLSFADCLPAGYNLTRVNGVIVDATTITVSGTAPNPGGPLVTKGTVSQFGSVQLCQKATTFFGQGSGSAIYVLELGYKWSPAGRLDDLSAWIIQNPKSFYGYLLDRDWGWGIGNVNSLLFFAQQWNSATHMVYFWWTLWYGYMTTGDGSAGNPFVPTVPVGKLKNLITLVEAPNQVNNPNAASRYGEFTQAAMFYEAMAFHPSPISRVAPMAFRKLSGVTFYPTQNNGYLLKQMKQYNYNYVATGAEGGIGYNTIYTGVTSDGQDYFNWWFTIDWVQIHAQEDVSNEVINGSNNPLAPLYYNQAGVDRVHARLYGTLYQASVYGMVLGRLVMSNYNQPDLQAAVEAGAFENAAGINAIPFIDYVRANKSDYGAGEYRGLSVTFIPARGFIHIQITIVATNIVTP
jgi:hypothetical protein